MLPNGNISFLKFKHINNPKGIFDPKFNVFSFWMKICFGKFEGAD